MNNFMKKNIIFIIILVSMNIGSFYGGTIYQQSKRIPIRSNDYGQSQTIGEKGTRGGIEGSLLNGEIIEKDEQNIVIKMLDDSSRIVFFFPI